MKERMVFMKERIIKLLNLIVKVSFVFSFFAILFILLKMNMFPTQYIVIYCVICSIILIFDFLSDFILKKFIFKIISIVVSLIFVIINLIIYIYLSKTDGFINSLQNNNILETFYVAVLSDSDYNEISDLNNLKIGTLYSNDESYSIISDNIKDEINYEEVYYENLFAICTDLKLGNTNAIILSEQNKKMIEENDALTTSLKYIYTIKVKARVNVTAKKIDVTKDPFIVYISGIDTDGEISNVSRSDVNILAIVNPNNRKILLVTIPRDYYVLLHGTTGPRDILTHAGLYGVDMSITTIEDLLGIDINYYIRLNFSTLIKAVDIIGGIDVYSEFDFNTYGYQFYKGYNTVNGEYALAYSRARKNFEGGDRQRGKNQLHVIEAMVKKVSTSNVILNKYLSILEGLKGTFQTNFDSKSIYALVRMQLSDMSEWNIEEYSLDGANGRDYTYSLGDIIAFVMEPDYNTVNTAKDKINEMMQ